MPLVGFERDAFQPHFDNQSDILTYFPQELKRRVLRSFPALTEILKGKMEPDLGLFSLITMIPKSESPSPIMSEPKTKSINPSQPKLILCHFVHPAALR